jgi:hypothetical protein
MLQLTLESPPDVEPAFTTTLETLRHKYATLWRSTPATPPPPCDLDRRRQRATERATDRFADEMEADLRAGPAGGAERAALRDRLQRRLRDFARDGLELPAAQRDLILSDAWLDSTGEFAHRARAFDEGIELLDLFQALRNVWIMNVLQAFLDRPVRLTSAMLGYSLLYPYTDNPLDDPALSAEGKRSFCDRLERRLRGEPLPAVDERERAVFDLVAMVEEQYCRDAHPEVFLSLLAIHDAQERSLHLQSVDGEEDDVLGLSVAKGGASVLADGYLVAGELDRDEADFCFGYGVVLQLMDDLQDVEQDLDAGHVTLFTRGARHGQLDDLASRLHNFLGAVLDGSTRLAGARFDTLKDLIRSHCSQLIVQSAAQHPRYFSPRFLGRLEGRSPVRFVYARWKRQELRRRLHQLDATLKRSGRLGSLFEAFAGEGLQGRADAPRCVSEELLARRFART